MNHLKICLAESGQDFRSIFNRAGQSFNRHRRVLLLIFLLTLMLVITSLPCEMDWLHRMQGERNDSLRRLAKNLSFWGDWYTGTVLICALLWLTGWIVRHGYLRQAAVGCLMAALLSGLFADVFRYGLGRARPNAGVAEGLYGPTLKARFHSFPSGHTTTAFGTAVALSILFPPMTLPALTLAGGVGWSRLYLDYHHPSDVLMGMVLGSSFGLIFGIATRNTGKGATRLR
ncbi:phosphatase PAP2 family protein [Candidatus Woesearchaeota archaeon]|nr:phosphatase PAP2 family protein [Candidatus Woesearchaeota archaeon]